MTNMAMNDMTKDARTDSVIDKLRMRFVATALVKLDGIDAAIARLGSDDAATATAEIKSNAHTLKGMGGSFGFMSVTRIAEALEDYLAESGAGAVMAADTQHYSNAMRAIVVDGVEPGEDELDSLIGSLPAPPCPQ